MTILVDDMGFWAMGCAGNKDVRTPNLDRLASEGTRFDNFFCASPVCSPARASILTGRIPSAHGVHDWIAQGNSSADGARIEYLKDIPGYTQLLGEQGYICALSGKWHLGEAHVPQKGFSYWNVHARGGGPYYGAPMIDGENVYQEPRYITEVITDHALEFLDSHQDSDKPFCLEVHYTAPHSPWTRENHPTALWDDYHHNCAFTATPNLPIHPWQIASAPAGHDEESRRNNLAGYYAAITAMDEQVGRLLDYLEETKQRENTLVMFTSDNGMNMGHHGLWGKGNASYPQNMYEQSIKVPTIISQPGEIAQNRVHRSMLSHYDLFPTILEWAGITAPDDALRPGSSFAAILKGSDKPIRDRVFIFDEYGPTRMIRTDKWKYVHRSGALPCELYDLENDPDEACDLLGNNPGSAAPTKTKTNGALSDKLRQKRQELEQELIGWFKQYALEQRNGFKLPLTGRGQLDLCWKQPITDSFDQTIELYADKNAPRL